MSKRYKITSFIHQHVTNACHVPTTCIVTVIHCDTSADHTAFVTRHTTYFSLFCHFLIILCSKFTTSPKFCHCFV